MSEEKIYSINKNCKTYLKLKNSLKRLFSKALILSIIMLISFYIIDEILNLSAIYIIYIYLIITITLIIETIINYLKLIKIGNSYIIKSKNEILFFYHTTSKEILSSFNHGMIVGGNIVQSHSNIDKAIGIGIMSKATSLNKDDTNEEKTNEFEEIPNMTIENIINDPKTFYDFYKNVHFIKKTRKYLYFNGDKINYNNTIKNSNFKIDRRLYKNIDDILN